MSTEPTLSGLPAGYTARPATLTDAPATAALLNAASQALLGHDAHSADQLTQDWQHPDFNLASDSVVLAADGALVGYTGVWDSPPHVQPEHTGSVHPAHTGRGLGTYLLAWAAARAQPALALAPAGTRVALTTWLNSLDRAAQDLCRYNGYQHTRSAWRMVIDLPEAAPPPAAPLPAGVRLRSFVLGQDDEATVQTVRACFADHWGYVERPFEAELEDWRYNWRTNSHFDPELWTLAVTHADGVEQVIGTSFARLHMNEDPALSWVFSVGVRRAWRRQGLAQALLLDSFARLHARGQRRVALGVDSGNLTGATRLYERIGMVVDPRHTHEIWEKELRPGADLATTALDSH